MAKKFIPIYTKVVPIYDKDKRRRIGTKTESKVLGLILYTKIIIDSVN
jgi:hypothetical protein